ncbi:ribosomal protein P0 (A0) (L10E) [Basidiobolus ranarum]|uniref:Ribosomal protein P0 (A0) (L10E) n=1 Tax=Basidiobolus ranarum TaxID=34480 RepID=A0ABR2VNR7_9FUNG
MLNISPFTYGMEVIQVYDQGNCFSSEVLDITDDVLLEHFLTGVQNVAALSLQIGFPTLASVPHVLINNYKNVLAISVATDYTFEAAEKVKAYLADPSAFAVAAPVAAASGSDAPAAAEKAEEAAEESDDDMGFGLFD